MSTSWTFCSLFWFVPIRRWYLILSFRYWVSKFYLKSCLGFFKHQKLFYVYQQYFNYYSLYVSLIDRIMLPVLFTFFTVITYFSPWGFRFFLFSAIIFQMVKFYMYFEKNVRQSINVFEIFEWFSSFKINLFCTDLPIELRVFIYFST